MLYKKLVSLSLIGMVSFSVLVGCESSDLSSTEDSTLNTVAEDNRGNVVAESAPEMEFQTIDEFTTKYMNRDNLRVEITGTIIDYMENENGMTNFGLAIENNETQYDFNVTIPTNLLQEELKIDDIVTVQGRLGLAKDAIVKKLNYYYPISAYNIYLGEAPDKIEEQDESTEDADNTNTTNTSNETANNVTSNKEAKEVEYDPADTNKDGKLDHYDDYDDTVYYNCINCGKEITYEGRCEECEWRRTESSSSTETTESEDLNQTYNPTYETIEDEPTEPEQQSQPSEDTTSDDTIMNDSEGGTIEINE